MTSSYHESQGCLLLLNKKYRHSIKSSTIKLVTRQGSRNFILFVLLSSTSRLFVISLVPSWSQKKAIAPAIKSLLQQLNQEAGDSMEPIKAFFSVWSLPLSRSGNFSRFLHTFPVMSPQPEIGPYPPLEKWIQPTSLSPGKILYPIQCMCRGVDGDHHTTKKFSNISWVYMEIVSDPQVKSSVLQDPLPTPTPNFRHQSQAQAVTYASDSPAVNQNFQNHPSAWAQLISQSGSRNSEKVTRSLFTELLVYYLKSCGASMLSKFSTPPPPPQNSRCSTWKLSKHHPFELLWRLHCRGMADKITGHY